MQITEGDPNLGAERIQWDELCGANQLVSRDSDCFFHQVLSTPCLGQIVGAEGPWLILEDGKRILDFHGNSVHQLGFAHPSVIQALEGQLAKLSYCTRRYTNQAAVELAELLVAHAPGDLRCNSRVLMTPSGSAAVGIALKIARAHTGRAGVIAFHDSFHGATLDAAAVGGQALFHRGMGSLLPGIHHVSQPSNDPDAEELIALLNTHADIGLVIAEPVRATTVKSAPEGYWGRVRTACDRNGVLLAFDEIPTGLGRTGSLWASETTGVTPDLQILGKGLGGGVFPQAAVVGHSRFNTGGVVPLAEIAVGHYTHEKSPIGAAVASATLGEIIDQDLPDRAARLGYEWAVELRKELGGFSCVLDVRQIGLMLAVQLSDSQLASRVMYRCLECGLSFKVGGGDSVVMFPPLNIDSCLLRQATQILREAVHACNSMNPV